MTKRSGQIILFAITGAAVIAALVVVSLLRPSVAPPAVPRPDAVEAEPVAIEEEVGVVYRIALVLDDAGHRLSDVEAFARFPGHINLAVLPNRPESDGVVDYARRLGHTLLVHQPMEAQGGADPGAGAIRVTDDDQAIRDQIRRNIAAVPGAVGLNNHMGSAATRDARVMEAVIQVLAEEEMLFLDSVTVADSVAYETARAADVSALRRDVFLDNVDDLDQINAQLDEAIAVARERGSVVTIGHVTSDVLPLVLEQRHDELVRNGFAFVSIQELLEGGGL